MAKIYTRDDIARQMKESLIKRFKECMRRQFASRVANGSGLPSHQLRDVVRTFAMAWSECYASQGDSIMVYCWGLVFGEITTEDWWPGDEWKFW